MSTSYIDFWQKQQLFYFNLWLRIGLSNKFISVFFFYLSNLTATSTNVFFQTLLKLDVFYTLNQLHFPETHLAKVAVYSLPSFPIPG